MWQVEIGGATLSGGLCKINHGVRCGSRANGRGSGSWTAIDRTVILRVPGKDG